MPLTIYCRFNSFCVNPRCAEKHHHSMDERKLLFTIINETPEIAAYKEPKVAKPMCKHGLRCFEKDCELQHGLTHDGRKLLINPFNKRLKAIQMREKIRLEIEAYKNGASHDWNELDTRS